MKKLLSLVLTLVMVLSLSTTAFAASGTLYLDIGQYVDSGKTVSNVTALAMEEGGSIAVAITHVSGTIYSCDRAYAESDMSMASFKVMIAYQEDATGTSFAVDFTTAGDNDLYTPTSGTAGTWSVYTPTTEPSGSNTITGPGTATGKVTGSYTPGAKTSTIYKVDIQWGSMAFTYTAAGKGTWDTAEHVYKNATTAGWSCAEGANVIAVTNHSNDGIAVTPTYTPSGDYTATMAFSPATLELTTADNGEGENGTGKATNGSITVTPGGTVPEGTNGTIGQITLSITGSSTSEDSGDSGAADSVTTYDALRDALNAGGEVKLGANIAVTDTTYPTMYENNNAVSTLDLNGKTITGCLRIYQGTLTVRDSAGGGKINTTSTSGAAIDVYSNVTIESGTVSGATYGINVYSGGNVTITGGSVTGSICSIYNQAGTVNVEGGTVTGSISSIHTLNMKGGTINGTISNNGTLNISGGIITGADMYGQIIQNAAVVNISGGTIEGAVVTTEGMVTITDGTIDGSDFDVAIISQGSNAETQIQGGNITGTLNELRGTITVTGGTFSSDPTVYVAGGCAVTKTGSKYVVS